MLLKFSKLVLLGVALSGYQLPVNAEECPDNLVQSGVIDAEFGAGAQAVTRCLRNQGERRSLKVVYQVNQQCKDSKCTAGYALGNINNAIKDYEITHGMTQGENYEINAVVHGGGWTQIVQDGATLDNGNMVQNPFQGAVEALLAKGVKIYFCQNTARSKGVKLHNMIPGVEFVTSGVTALADFQSIGYMLVQP